MNECITPNVNWMDYDPGDMDDEESAYRQRQEQIEYEEWRARFAGIEFCDCEFPIESGLLPVCCLRCNRYIDPAQLVASGDGSYKLKPPPVGE